MQRLLDYKYLYLAPLLLSAIFSLRSFRLNWNPAYRIFSAFIIFTLLMEIFAIAWKWEIHETRWWQYSKTNLWIYNFFIIVRFLAFLAFYNYLLESNAIKKWIRIAVIPFTFLGITNYFFIELPNTVNNLAMVAANLVTILLTLALFIQVLKDKRIIRLSADTKIWIGLGTLIYYTANLPFFMFFNYLLHEHLPIVLSFLYINDALNIIMYSFYLIAFLCNPQSTK